MCSFFTSSIIVIPNFIDFLRFVLYEIRTYAYHMNSSGLAKLCWVGCAVALSHQTTYKPFFVDIINRRSLKIVSLRLSPIA
jgi:hypothetical protein